MDTGDSAVEPMRKAVYKSFDAGRGLDSLWREGVIAKMHVQILMSYIGGVSPTLGRKSGRR